MGSLAQLPCCVLFVNLDSDVRVPSLCTQGCRNWNPPKPSTHKREVKPSLSIHLGSGIFPP